MAARSIGPAVIGGASLRRGVSRCPSLVVGAMALALPACQVDDLDLAGKGCPCASGWSCDPQTNTCVQGTLPADAGAGGGGARPDAASDAGGSDAGCQFQPATSPGSEGPRGWPNCNNGADDDCDGYADADDADCSLVYTVERAPTAPTIDGDCSEYYGAQSLSLRADADNVIIYWMMWDETALYVCAQVGDDSLAAANTDAVADRDGDIWHDDSLELYFDVAHDAGSSLQPDDYKLFLNAANVQADSLDGNADWSTTFHSATQLDGTLNSVADTDRGFVAELAITWTEWGVTPPSAQVVWGGNLMWNDLDEADGGGRTFEIWNGTPNVPDDFGDLRFVD